MRISVLRDETLRPSEAAPSASVIRGLVAHRLPHALERASDFGNGRDGILRLCRLPTLPPSISTPTFARTRRLNASCFSVILFCLS